MPLYRLATEILQSSLPFPELLPTDGSPSLYFEQDQTNQPPASPAKWLRSIELDGRVWLSTAKVETDFLLSFPRYADFLFSPATGHITCHPRAETDIDTVRHLLLDQVLPLVLSRRGFTVLHASAVASPHAGAMVFLGKSGSGKSTFAASLCTEGFSFIADDCLALTAEDGELLAVAVYPGLRLWDTSTEQLQWRSASFPNVAQYTEKKRISVADTGFGYDLGPNAISAIFLFNPDGDEVAAVELRELTVSESVIRLIESSYCLDPGDKGKNQVDFCRLSSLAQTVPVIQVRFPYDFLQFAQLREAVLSAPIRR